MIEVYIKLDLVRDVYGEIKLPIRYPHSWSALQSTLFKKKGLRKRGKTDDGEKCAHNKNLRFLDGLEHLREDYDYEDIAHINPDGGEISDDGVSSSSCEILYEADIEETRKQRKIKDNLRRKKEK